MLCTGAHGGQKSVLDPLELELKAIVVLGTKLQFSVRARSSLNH